MACYVEERRNRILKIPPLIGGWALCVVILIGATATTAVAQGDPNVAGVSVDLEVAQLYRISGIQDVTFSTFSGSGDLTATRSVCVWTNSASGSYRVTAHGDGADQAFTVAKQGDPSKVIPYTVAWITVDGTIGLTKQQGSANRTGANTVSASCASGPAAPASFEITVDDAQILSRPSGTYVGILTLSISPPT
jgi:hypothetical protein